MEVSYRWPLARDVMAEVTITGQDVGANHLEMLRKCLQVAKDALGGEGGEDHLTPEVKAKVVEDYLAGKKVIVIKHDYSISPGTLYRILHAAKVRLRKKTG